MTKMVQLSNDAYERLRAAKQPGESFSEVVRRLTARPRPLRLAGLRTKKEIDAHERWLKEMDEMEARDMDDWDRKHGFTHGRP